MAERHGCSVVSRRVVIAAADAAQDRPSLRIQGIERDFQFGTCGEVVVDCFEGDSVEIEIQPRVDLDIVIVVKDF